MDGNRERQVTDAFVTLASALATGQDVPELLDALCDVCSKLLDITSAGLLLADSRGVLHVLAASTENTRHLETFQVQRDEGPCTECFATGSPVLVPDLTQETERWPQFTAAAAMAGFVSVHALPMRLREVTLGAMGLFGASTGTLPADDVRLGQALADVASVAIVQDRDITDRANLNEQLQAALDSRVIIEQAKGVLAQHGDLDMEQAFNALRRYARDHNIRLADAAHGTVSRSLPAQQILEYARSKGLPGSV